MAFRVIQGGEIRVNTTTDNTQFEQSIAALEDGGWIVTWRDSHKDGNGNGIFQQRYAADGSTVGVETQVNTTTIGHQEAPRVTALSDGGWVVIWMSDPEADDDYIFEHIYQQRYDENARRSAVRSSLPAHSQDPRITRSLPP